MNLTQFIFWNEDKSKWRKFSDHFIAIIKICSSEKLRHSSWLLKFVLKLHSLSDMSYYFRSLRLEHFILNVVFKRWSVLSVFKHFKFESSCNVNTSLIASICLLCKCRQMKRALKMKLTQRHCHWPYQLCQSGTGTSLK